MQYVGGPHYSMCVGIGSNCAIGAAMPKPVHNTTADSSRAAPHAHPQPGKDVPQRHREVIRLLDLHTPMREIAAITGYSLRAIQYIAKRYRETGLAALDDRRTHGQGTAPLLTCSLQRELVQVLKHPPPSGGAWTGPKVAQWMSVRTGKPIARQRGWEYLCRLRADGMRCTESHDDQRNER